MSHDSVATILIADDVDHSRESMASILRTAGFQVVEATTGGELLRQMNAKPDVVVLEIALPDRSGIELCQCLKSDPTTAATPILFISGVATNPAEQVLGLEMADGHLTKPVHAAVLVAQIRALLRTYRAESELRRSEERFRALMENSADGMSLVGPGGEIRYEAPTLHRVLGYAPNKFLHQTTFDLLHPDDRERILSLFFGVAQQPGATVSAEFRMQHQDGSWRWIDGTAKNLLHNPAVAAIVINYRDITERKRSDELLRQREERLSAIVEGTPECIKLLGPDGRLLDMNSAGLAMVEAAKKEDVIGKSVFDLVAPDHRESFHAFHERVCRGEKGTLEFDIVGLKGSRRTVETHAAPVPAADGRMLHLAVTRDVTHRKQLEEQLLHVQKMESVVRLAGGIAHEINNQMTVVEGFCELLDQLPELTDAGKEYVGAARQAGRKAAQVAQQLLAFSRRQILMPQVFSLAQELGDFAFLRPVLPEDVKLEVVVEPDSGSVRVDLEHLKQVIIHLALNARDAMPSGGRFMVAIRSAREWGPNAIPGPYLLIETSDTGCGMDAATQARIFDPFFTTKAVGKGTGLGLATAYGFIKQSGGHIEVASEIGVGTTFRIYLPRHPMVLTGTELASENASMPEGRETVLLVEDEAALRGMIQQTMQKLGYNVLVARDGAEGLAVSTGYMSTIHLLVTDVVMPELSGRQLADRLCQMRPGIKVLYISGHTDDTVLRHGVEKTEVLFLAKPFSSAALAQKMRAVLDA